ncbi:glycosyltransferase family 2 protein [Cohnella hongkongensis]|uniref:Glycosyltransferase family 2 protein n=1 Tax=Cohnella hongkongensis TaxID=178337 RepID=A0ABV9F9U5_9BACL
MAAARKRTKRARGRRASRAGGRASRRTYSRKRATRLGRYRQGLGDGYREGVQFGLQSFPVIFEGTSIVIPTYNQLAMVKMCIESILENTNVPYEIIVVDNASTDGTAEYLQSLGGQVRYRALEKNLGFAGAVNVGMMMAKGKTILLLNNDTLVTENWLHNLLACLNSDEAIGMVGPMTNFISGEQQIAVPYTNLADMPAFAREFNRPDPSRWRRTERLTGFCLLFRRELFEGIGYFDEGYEIGNFEDDDYNIRVRLLGKSLVMAQDTFIHHFGSVSMKALGDRFQEVNDRNEQYFIEKWRNPEEWIRQAAHRRDPASRGPLHAAAFYPERIVVQGIGAHYYWIEQGQRRLVEGAITFPAVRLSQIDLKRWPAGAPISVGEAEARWRGLDGESGWETGVAQLQDGTLFYAENGKARRIVSASVMKLWQLHYKPIRSISPEDLSKAEEGLPIIAPPLLKQVL